MNRIEFLAQLERLLLDIPEQEREAALDYYESYFEEAGKENESQVIQELGSPGKVAAIIKADLEENPREHGEYTEHGYTDERFEDREMPGTKSGQASAEESGENNWDGQKYQNTGKTEKRGYNGPYRRAGYGENSAKRYKRNGSLWILIVLLLIFALPIWGGIGLGILGALLGLVLGICGLLIGIAMGGVGLTVGGFMLLVHTLVFQLGSPATALAAVGASFLLIALGLLMLLGFLLLAVKVFPAVFRWFVDCVQRIFHRGMPGR